MWHMQRHQNPPLLWWSAWGEEWNAWPKLGGDSWRLWQRRQIPRGGTLSSSRCLFVSIGRLDFLFMLILFVSSSTENPLYIFLFSGIHSVDCPNVGGSLSSALSHKACGHFTIQYGHSRRVSQCGSEPALSRSRVSLHTQCPTAIPPRTSSYAINIHNIHSLLSIFIYFFCFVDIFAHMLFWIPPLNWIVWIRGSLCFLRVCDCADARGGGSCRSRVEELYQRSLPHENERLVHVSGSPLSRPSCMSTKK